MNSLASKLRTSFLPVVILLAVGFVAGCRTCQLPCDTRVALSVDVTTPSADAARAATVSPHKQEVRGFATVEVHGKQGEVEHTPLYYEDPFECECCDDGRFAVTGLDHLSWPLGTTRYLFNTALFPVSALVTPPWLTMASDGVPSRCVIGLEPQDATAAAQ